MNSHQTECLARNITNEKRGHLLQQRRFGMVFVCSSGMGALSFEWHVADMH